MTFLVAFVASALTILLLNGIGAHLEARDYNKGTCRRCGGHFHHFDTDSQGGRGYICDGCGLTTWVSHRIVDKNHKEV